MRAQDLMTRNPACVTPDDTARRAAQLMEENDCGCLPVVNTADGRVVGVVTDRDIAVRGAARGRGPETSVRELMTRDPDCCREDDDLKDVERVMSDRQVRRVVIVNADRHPVGMVAQADLARAVEDGGKVTERDVARVVESISAPSGPRSERPMD